MEPGLRGEHAPGVQEAVGSIPALGETVTLTCYYSRPLQCVGEYPVMTKAILTHLDKTKLNTVRPIPLPVGSIGKNKN